MDGCEPAGSFVVHCRRAIRTWDVAVNLVANFNVGDVCRVAGKRAMKDETPPQNFQMHQTGIWFSAQKCYDGLFHKTSLIFMSRRYNVDSQ